MPPNGGTVHAQNAPMEPFFSEAKLNTRLSARLLGITLRVDSFPRGHANLDGGHLGLSEDAFDGVLVPEVLFASFGPDVVQDEAFEYVQGLSWVGEAAGMVCELSGRVVLLFQCRFPEEDEGPIDVELHWSSPVVPYSFEGSPCFERPVTLEQAVLGGFLRIALVDFAVWEDSHVLQPRPHWQSLIEGDPDEGADFSRTRVVPYSGGYLWSR